jgi:hypothetical protein
MYLQKVGGYGDSAMANSKMLAEFNSVGAPLTSPTSLSLTTSTPETFTAAYGGFNLQQGQSSILMGLLAIDPSGNIWITDNENFWEISPGLSVTIPQTPFGSGVVFPSVTNTVSGMAMDASGNMWVGGNNGIAEFDNTGNLVLSTNGISPVDSFGYGAPSYLTFDSNGGLWSSDNDGFGDLYQIDPFSGLILFDPYFTPGGAFTPLVADGAGNIYGCGGGTPGGLENGQDLVVYSNGAQVTSFPISTARGCGNQMALDGQGHIFAVTGVSAPGIVDEFTTEGRLLSSATGYTGTSSEEPPTINLDPSLELASLGHGGYFLTSLAATAIDGSGNLWVLNADTGPTSNPGNVLVEFVGIAAPVVTPTSAALSSGQIGVRP